jgi:GNAT superfamily N-acetyltransferase
VSVLLCICGERLEGSDDELFGLLRAHSDAAHADLPLSDDDIREALGYWSAGDRWDGGRRDVTGPIEIKPLGADTLDDFLAFFDRRAFMDNPFWFGCYCLEPHHIDPTRHPASENRATKIGLVKEGAARGFLAYVDGEPVGWCNAAPRSMLPGVLHGILESVEVDPDEPVGSIACFTIAAPYRGSGVGRALLVAACEGLRDQGLDAVEAYPRKGELSQARSYRGPLEMYESAGFERHGETEGSFIVRKRL